MVERLVSDRARNLRLEGELPVNHFRSRSSVMLLAILVTASTPVVAQQRQSLDVHVPIVTANDPINPNPAPPPDPGIPPQSSGFALHS